MFLEEVKNGEKNGDSILSTLSFSSLAESSQIEVWQLNLYMYLLW